MSAYWISIYHDVLDAEKAAAYSKLARPAIIEAGGRFLAAADADLTFEADGGKRTVLIEFDSLEAARTAYESPAYTEALRVLDGAVVREVRIVPAL